MSFFKDDLKRIRAFLFDVDGVLSSEMSPLDGDGEPMRTANVKDGFALKDAIQKGYLVGIITGGAQKRVRLRYEKLGVSHYYEMVSDKMKCYEDFLLRTGLSSDDVLYMGDDLPDVSVMKRVAIPTCPADAVPEVKAIARYVSDKTGGEGCVRDVIEQVLRAQEKWNQPNGIQ